MKTKEELIRMILLIVGGVVLLLFAIIPFIWMMIISFMSNPYFLFPGTGANSLTLQNYMIVLGTRDLHFVAYIRNTLIIAIVVSLFVMLLTSLSGYAVSRMRFPGRMFVPLFVLAMSMFPQISIVGALYNFFADLGLLNTHIALILPYTAWSIPIALWINMSYFTQIPIDLDKAALIDGAGRLKIIFKVILPIALPGLFSSFLLVFIMCFNEFLFALMITLNEQSRTLSVGIALFEGYMGQVPWGQIMAASAVTAVPLIAITVVFQKYVVAGLSSGSVKG